MKTVNILGTDYKIEIHSQKEDKELEDCDGYCDWSAKLIVVADKKDCENEKHNLKNLDLYYKKVTRHEIVHAFLSESGLREASSKSHAWATNEEMVDWIAYNGLKIYEAWKEADAI